MERKRNLLFLFTDEQRADTLECYGNTVVQAPNLNGLARRSFVFERSCVTQPVCTPARSSIMTGLYPHTNGCTENNIPSSLRQRPLRDGIAGLPVRLLRQVAPRRRGRAPTRLRAVGEHGGYLP